SRTSIIASGFAPDGDLPSIRVSVRTVASARDKHGPRIFGSHSREISSTWSVATIFAPDEKGDFESLFVSASSALTKCAPDGSSASAHGAQVFPISALVPVQG